MTRVATVDDEDYLLMIAQHGIAYHVETLVRKYRRVIRLQEDGEQQHEERSLRFCLEPNGSMVLHVRLPAEKGALVLKAIERPWTRTNRMFPRKHWLIMRMTSHILKMVLMFPRKHHDVWVAMRQSAS